MTNKIYPCLWFDGQAQTAAHFYCSIFKNSKITTDNQMVVVFELNGQKFMGLNGGPKFNSGKRVMEAFMKMKKFDIKTLENA